MSRKFERAGTIAVAATLLSIMLGAEGSVAAKANPVQTSPARAEIAPEPAPFISSPVVQPLPEQSQPAQSLPAARATNRAPVAVDIDAAPVRAGSLAKLVSGQPQPSELSRELNCLAGAVYFESKGETLAGQLAVGRVVVARSKSGRFPDSYCGVVFQRSQFSFVRGNSMPPIDKRSRNWKHAVAIAQIAHAGAWRSEAEGALFFHAAYVSPGWRLKRVARIDNHVFYR